MKIRLTKSFLRKKSIIQDLLKLFLAFSKKLKKSEKVILYNLDPINYLLILILLFVKVEITVIVADYSYQGLYRYLQKSILSFKRINIITLRQINELNSKRIMPGIWTEEIRYSPLKKQNSILLSGSVGSTTGLWLALEAFSSGHLQHYELNICGVLYQLTEKEKNEFHRIIEKSDNIHFFGLVKREVYQNLLDQAWIGLSLRDPQDKQHETNFPSKIIEYCMNGLWVISTLEYPELEVPSLRNIEYSSAHLIEEINQLNQMKPNYILTSDIILETCNPRNLL